MADTTGSTDKPTILIVDDSPDDISLISELLKELYAIKIAGNGERALKVALTGTPPDLILLDIMMPVMDGYETCRRLKETPEALNIPVIFLTAKTGIEDEMKGFALGAVDYITKPISPPILLARVQTHLQLKRVSDYLKDKNAFLEDEVRRRIDEILIARSEINRREEALWESKSMLRESQKIAGLGTYSLDIPSGIFKTSPIMDELLGIDEAYDHSLKGWMALIHADDRAMMVDYLRNNVIGRGLSFDKEFRIFRVRDKAVCWLHALGKVEFDADGRPVLIHGTSQDITKRKQSEKQLRDTLERLRMAIGTTVKVLVSTVEARDPYTSGHQIRTANLARTIASEMGLPQDRIEGLRMAGSIHDIGKISIPAEILSKPSKLSAVEFSLIQAHAQRGFEILKGVESSWPLAEIVYQHHERMDGSGYPRKLKRDDILIEARILAVADVVEAMASNRPYRPSLGIDAALNEIEKNRGISYDYAVAAACLRLFREKGFELEGYVRAD